jgi:TonB family protein
MAEAWKKWEGQVVNREFELLRYLGGSEHSAVFLTKREREPREVAIKLIPANAEPELQLSWWELAAKLSHPHLLRLFQTGRCELDGTELLYAVTEYAEESLAQIIPYRALTPEETRDMLQSVLDGLAYIHGKGFVHGHITPSNIMAVGDQIKVSGDGLCGAGESSRVLGATSGYAAPETADGGGMSAAADVWSLGMTLVESLTQRPPVWDGTETAEPVVPETLPDPFFDIASHCLRRNPQSRWTVAEIARRLQQPTLAPRTKESVESQGRPRKWSYVIPVVAVGLLLVVLGLRAMHRHASAEPGASSTIESQTAQAEAKQRSEAGQPPPVSGDSDKEQAAAVPAAPKPAPAASSKSATRHAGGENSGASRAQGEVAQQVLPDVSRSALRTINGRLKVRVKVTVDSSGNVTAARFDSRGPSKYFADRTLQAAQRWTFKPPQVSGQAVPSEWILKFEFVKSGTIVHPAQILP